MTEIKHETRQCNRTVILELLDLQTRFMQKRICAERDGNNAEAKAFRKCAQMIRKRLEALGESN